jgi:flagellar protein FlbD
MIRLHRLSSSRDPFWLNPDLVLSLESTPDCHILLTTGSSMAVCEREEEVVRLIREWRTDVLKGALR